MKPGDVVESAMWVTGDESPEMRERYKRDVVEAITYLCAGHGYTVGPVTWTEKRPEEDRVPPVPDHIQGQRVRLLVGEAQIVGEILKTLEGSFVANLDPDDLHRLRTITREAYEKRHGSLLTDQQCDEVIDQHGPDAALATLNEGRPWLN